jgi:hypothetical protein
VLKGGQYLTKAAKDAIERDPFLEGFQGMHFGL